jgi:hypothetical protein
VRISDLQAQVRGYLKNGLISEALISIQVFIDKIINDPRATDRVLDSKECDDLCREIAVYRGVDFGARRITHTRTTVFLLSEVITAGGHIELLKDYISSGQFSKPHIFITDIFIRQNMADVADLATKLNVPVVVAKGSNTGELLESTLKFLEDNSPNVVILLNHHQDSVAITATLMQHEAKRIFIHHADHQLSLGVTCEEFDHIDIHNVGFYRCLGANIKGRIHEYWPLTVKKKGTGHKKQFISSGFLKTASSGSCRKFEAGNYAYEYCEILPKILAYTQGVHIHIGALNSELLQRLRCNFEKQGVDWNCFVHFEYAPSVANELLNQSIDLYISSFPLGGAKTVIEAMSVGIPLLMHENYRGRLAGCCDLVYPNAFIWHKEDDIFRVLGGINKQVLQRHSQESLQFYEKYCTESLLIKAINHGGISLMPNLKKYEGNELLRFIEDIDPSENQINFLMNEVSRLNKDLEEIYSNDNPEKK